MAASDDSIIREELIGAVLGELSLLRRDVGGLCELLENAGKRFKDDSDLAMLRLASRSDKFLQDFRESSTDVLLKAKEFGEAREQLMGEIAIRQYDQAHDRHLDLIRSVIREQSSPPQFTKSAMAAWGAGFGVAAAVVGAAVLAVLHIL